MSGPMLVVAAVALLSASLGAAAPAEDAVPHLPGLDGRLPSALYSGFLASEGDEVHYMLVESEGNPDTDPLILWTNGGPGASSLIGFFQELGPVVISSNASLVANPYAFSKLANVVFFESPTGVGYSTCDEMDSGESCRHDDTTTAELNFASLEKLLQKFPEYHGRDFMIWGESYAGVYIPMLADLMHNRSLPLNFLGFSVGDPCTDQKFQHLGSQLHFDLFYAVSRGFISSRIHSFITSSCVRKEGEQFLPDYGPEGCRSAWRKYYISTSNDDGYGPAASLPRGGFIDPYTCFGPNGDPFNRMMSEYLNTEEVREALNVPEGRQHHTWGRHLNYTKQYLACYYGSEAVSPPKYNESMAPIYRRLVGSLPRVVVFNGDSDPDVQFQGTEDAVSAFGFRIASGGDWRPWFYRPHPVPLDLLGAKPPFWGPKLSHRALGPQMAGYVTDYAGNLSFVTVHDCGHMVPQFQPQVALHFFGSVLSGRLLSPNLDTQAIETASDEDFFGEGLMSEWVELAQSAQYAGHAVTSSTHLTYTHVAAVTVH